MAHLVKMPVLGNSVEEVRIVQWFKQEGDVVSEGEPLGEVETDKTNMEFPSPFTGVVRKLLVSVNDYIAVEAAIAVIGALGEDITPLLTTLSSGGSHSENTEKAAPLFQPLSITPIPLTNSVANSMVSPPETRPETREENAPVISPRALKLAAKYGILSTEFTGPGSGPQGRVVEKDVVDLYEKKQAAMTIEAGIPSRLPQVIPLIPTPSSPVATDVPTLTATLAAAKVSPLAQAIATEAGMDLAQVAGSGSGGRILASDVRPLPSVPTAISEQSVPTAISEQSVPTAISEQSVPTAMKPKIITLVGIRKRVADNLSKSVREKPHVTLHTRADMTNANRLRADLLPVIEKTTGVRLSPTDIVMKACAVALLEFPHVNAHIEGDIITLFETVNIGLAVSLGDEGLIVPVLHDVQTKGLAALAMARNDVASRARSGKLTPNELVGGTFTITNLGNYGIEAFNPIIPPPQVAILGVCSIQDEVVAVNGVPSVRPRMGLSLSFDHRAIDGAPAAAFLARVREIIENPALLLA